MVCRIKGLHPQVGSIDFCLRNPSGRVCQLFRHRADTTMRVGGENGFFQDAKDGFSKPYGTVMISNFIIEHDLSQVLDDLKEMFEKINNQVGHELDFDVWLTNLKASFGLEVNRLQRIERLTIYSSIRYIIRDFCEMHQRTLRKQLTTKYSLK